MKVKFFLRILILMIVLSTVSCGKSKEHKEKILNNEINNHDVKIYENEHKEIEEIYKKFYEYKINKNIKDLNEILDSNFTLTHMTGYKQNKDEWFSQIKDEQMKYYGYTIDNIDITLNKNTGQLIGRSKTDARIYGSRNKWNLQLIMRIKKIDDKWIISEAITSSY